jgi:ATP-dependent helicase HepA
MPTIIPQADLGRPQPHNNPNIGRFVTSSENDLGLGKIWDSNREFAVIEYFDSATQVDRPRYRVTLASVRPSGLGQQQRVYYFDLAQGTWRIGRVNGHVGQEVFVALPNQEQARILARDAFVRWNRPLKDPWDHLVARITESPFFHNGRTELVSHFIQQRGVSAGMTGLLSAPVALEAHQIDVVRRVLLDPVPRYLLADEVGLGKTIEAGVIIRQHVLDFPERHRILILTPPSLMRQWSSELTDRCQVDERYGHNIRICSFEDLATWANEQPTFVVVDEAHHISRGLLEVAGHPLRDCYEALRRISAPERCRHLLLLSATPVVRNEHAFLGMLHLLDPLVYDLHDPKGFEARVQSRVKLGDLFMGFVPEQHPFTLEDFSGQLRTLFPQDQHLASLLDELAPMLGLDGDPAIPSVVNRVRSHLSETYRLHRRILRNRRGEALNGLLPGRHSLLAAPWQKEDRAAAVEGLLEEWRCLATAAVWGEEQSERSLALGRVFIILLTSFWGDPLALLHCLRLRCGLRVAPPPDFGQLLTLADLEFVTSLKTPLFAGEKAILDQMLGLEQSLRDFRAAFLTKNLEFVRTLLARNFRIACFCTCKTLADDFHARLTQGLARPIARHTPANDGWKQIWQTSEPQVIVCDASAEEGVNLQGGQACMLHLDLPFSPNRLEQRLGRLDRFGVGRPVRSYTLLPAGVDYLAAWCDSLDSAWQVFSRSIAALQYVVESEMTVLSHKLFLEGAEAIRTATTRLSANDGLEREFRFIRNQDALDALESHSQEISSALAELVEAYDARHEDFKRALDAWCVGNLQFQALPEPNSENAVWRYNYQVDNHATPLTLLPPSELMGRFRGAFDFDAHNPDVRGRLTHLMAFRRESAQSRRVPLARLGHPVVDAFHQQLTWDDRGTNFAFWRRSAGVIPGIWFRLDFIVEAEVPLLDDGGMSQNVVQRMADAAFPPIIQTLWMNQDLMEPDAATLQLLNSPYNAPEDNSLRALHWPAVLERVDCGNWTDLCAAVRAECEARLQSIHALETLTAEKVAALEILATEVRTQLTSRLATLAADRVAERDALEKEILQMTFLYESLADGIRQPVLRLDAAGVVFLSPNALPVINP